MSYKRLTELMDSLSPERRAKVEARAKELKEEFPIAAAIIGELVEERAQLQARITSLRKNCNITSRVETFSPLQDGTLVPRSWWARAGERNFVHDPK